MFCHNQFWKKNLSFRPQEIRQMNRAFRLQSHIYWKQSPPREYLLFKIEINELRNDKNVVNYDFAEGRHFVLRWRNTQGYLVEINVFKVKARSLACDINCRHRERLFRLETSMNIHSIPHDISTGINFRKFKDNKLANCRYGKLTCDSRIVLTS